MQLPVISIIGRSLWFVIANLFTLIRLSWLPLVALIVTEWAIAYWFASQAVPGTTVEKLSEEWSYLLASFSMLVPEGLALSVIAVRVHRMILFHDKRPGEYFAFPFGKTELLYVIMGALAFLFVVLVAGIFATSVGILLAALNVGGNVRDIDAMLTPDDPLSVAIFIPSMVILMVLTVWATLRLSAWPPAVVANNSLSLGEGWRLGRGQVLVYFGLLVISTMLIFLPMGFAYWYAAAATSGGWGFLAATPFAVFDDKVQAALEHRLQIPHPNVLLFEFGSNLIFVTYTVALLSYAYKALKGFDAHEPIDASGQRGLDMAEEEVAEAA